MARIALRFDEFGWEAMDEIAGRHGLGIGEIVSASCRRYLARDTRDETLSRLVGDERTGNWRWVSVDLEPAELRILEHRARQYRTAFEVLLRESVITLIAELDSGRLSAELVRPEYPAGAAEA